MTNVPTTPKPEHFPSPFAALLLTIGGVAIATFATVFMMVMTGSKPTVASLGIGEAIGLGAVASFAAQRVAAPHRERLGLRSFAPAYIPILLMLSPLAVVLSEMDNVVRSILPPIEIPPEMQELQDRGDAMENALKELRKNMRAADDFGKKYPGAPTYSWLIQFIDDLIGEEKEDSTGHCAQAGLDARPEPQHGAGR